MLVLPLPLAPLILSSAMISTCLDVDSHECDAGPWLDGEIGALQHLDLFPAWVCEADILKADGAISGSQHGPTHAERDA
jgi:hypothetical protein